MVFPKYLIKKKHYLIARKIQTNSTREQTQATVGTKYHSIGNVGRDAKYQEKIRETKTDASMVYFYTRTENTVACSTKTGCIMLHTKKLIFISLNMSSKSGKCQNDI